MNGKVVVITGASGRPRQGASWMPQLARGAKVAAIDHAATTIPATPEQLHLGGVDLSDADQALKAINAVAAHFGRLDVLINIAGAFSFETVAEGDPKTWQRLYAINTLTAVNASRAAIPHLSGSGAGRIINIGAMGALQAGAGMGPYAASKAGVHRSDRGACCRAERQGHRQCRAAVHHRYARQPAGHAAGGFQQMGDTRRTRQRHPFPRQR